MARTSAGQIGRFVGSDGGALALGVVLAVLAHVHARQHDLFEALGQPLVHASRTARLVGVERGIPRVKGMMQNVQKSLQPSSIFTMARVRMPEVASSAQRRRHRPPRHCRGGGQSGSGWSGGAASAVVERLVATLRMRGFRIRNCVQHQPEQVVALLAVADHQPDFVHLGERCRGPNSA